MIFDSNSFSDFFLAIQQQNMLCILHDNLWHSNFKMIMFILAISKSWSDQKRPDSSKMTWNSRSHIKSTVSHSLAYIELKIHSFDLIYLYWSIDLESVYQRRFSVIYLLYFSVSGYQIRKEKAPTTKRNNPFWLLIYLL